jgi:hypothetical protein
MDGWREYIEPDDPLALRILKIAAWVILQSLRWFFRLTWWV